MGKLTIFQFEKYDVKNDAILRSRRWGTREAIENIACGTVLENTAVEVDESAIESDIRGLSAIDFSPHGRQGFQTSVPTEMRKS